MAYRPCQGCCMPFIPKYPGQVCCSRSCATSYRAWWDDKNVRQPCTCRHCGKSYLPKAANRVTFCSRDCMLARQSQKAAERQAAAPKKEPPVRECRVCHRPFPVTRRNSRDCSAACSAEWSRQRALSRYQPQPARRLVCLVCSTVYLRQGRGNHAKYCSSRCARIAWQKRRASYIRMQQRLRRQALSQGEKISPCDIFHRDQWRCQLCRRPVKRDARAPHPLSPVLDHIIPLSRGGKHEVVNVQCAHFLCNSKRTHLGSAQMRLW
jgi:HNH endonuclease